MKIITFPQKCFKEIKIILLGKIYSQNILKSGFFSSEVIFSTLFICGTEGPNNF